MFIDKDKEKQILGKFFIALCDAETEMSKAINKEIKSIDTHRASVNEETANVINRFSDFMNNFEDILRFELGVDTLAFFEDEESK